MDCTLGWWRTAPKDFGRRLPDLVWRSLPDSDSHDYVYDRRERDSGYGHDHDPLDRLHRFRTADMRRDIRLGTLRPCKDFVDSIYRILGSILLHISIPMKRRPIKSPEPTTARAAVGRYVVLQSNPTINSLAVAAQL